MRIRSLISLLSVGVFNMTVVALSCSDLDSDGDGLTDEEEKSDYYTDWTKFDTDGDGVSDGDEIKNGTDPLYPDNPTTSPVTNLVDGCYYVDGSYVGIDTNATRIVFPVSCDKASVKGCEKLEEVVMPLEWNVEGEDFSGCWSLRRVVFRGGPSLFFSYNKPSFQSIAMRASATLSLLAMADSIYYPSTDSSAWIKVLKNLGYGGVYGSYEGEWKGDESICTISSTQGFVTVITEVKSSGAVSVPSEWSGNYPSFVTKYGTNIGKALMMKSGKKDGAGNDMFVWQDYVAGTDPTNPDDKFTASITLVEGVPVISYSPEPTPEQKALRTYKTLGKKQLQDKDWTDISTFEGEDMKPFNFFKVTVEMK